MYLVVKFHAIFFNKFCNFANKVFSTLSQLNEIAQKHFTCSLQGNEYMNVYANKYVTITMIFIRYCLILYQTVVAAGIAPASVSSMTRFNSLSYATSYKKFWMWVKIFKIHHTNQWYCKKMSYTTNGLCLLW